eukprot:GILJ01006265.1.p1 GENE.GILJ01006265.1~~GILJ01006265.1.p1  ORF type:complete len:891 (+),score=155.32 GILJ01006265.1:49-2673(+)
MAKMSMPRRNEPARFSSKKQVNQKLKDKIEAAKLKTESASLEDLQLLIEALLAQSVATTSLEPVAAEPVKNEKDGLFREGEAILTTDNDVLCTVKRMIGKGGMGEVYLVDLDGRVMAMKCLALARGQKDDEAYQQLFLSLLRETETLLQLGHHNNIAQVTFAYPYFHDARDAQAKSESLMHAQESLLLFVEYVSGGSLGDAIKNSSLLSGTSEETHERLLRLTMEMAQGLDHIHDEGIIHQDFKPDNVLLTDTGVAKITDYGTSESRNGVVSRAIALEAGPSGSISADDVDKADGQTLMVNVTGATPAYWSPEQAAAFIPQQPGAPNSSHFVTKRTDIYSWALSVIHMYAGNRFWKRGDRGQEILDAYLSQVPPPPAVPMPPKLVDLLRQCLQQDQSARPHDFVEVQESLYNIYAEQTGNEYTSTTSTSGKSDSRKPIAKAYTNLGAALRNRGLYQEAEEILSKALPYVEAKLNLALTYMRNGKERSAAEVFEELLDECPDFEPMYANYGRLLCQQQRFKRAVDVLEAGLDIYSHDPLMYNNLAEALVRAFPNRPDCVESAVRNVCVAIEVEPTEGGYWDTLGFVLNAMGDKALAKRCLEKALALNHTLATSYQQLSTLCQDNAEEFVRCLKDGLNFATPRVFAVSSVQPDVYHTKACSQLLSSDPHTHTTLVLTVDSNRTECPVCISTQRIQLNQQGSRSADTMQVAGGEAVTQAMKYVAAGDDDATVPLPHVPLCSTEDDSGAVTATVPRSAADWKQISSDSDMDTISLADAHRAMQQSVQQPVQQPVLVSSDSDMKTVPMHQSLQQPVQQPVQQVVEQSMVQVGLPSQPTSKVEVVCAKTDLAVSAGSSQAVDAQKPKHKGGNGSNCCVCM